LPDSGKFGYERTMQNEIKTRLGHLSVGVGDPKTCATALAELSDGTVEPFPRLENTYVCFWGGGWEGQYVEFYSRDHKLVPTEEGADFETLAEPASFRSTHFFLNVATPVEKIQEIARRYGFRYCYRVRGGGPLHEVWLENDLLVELVPHAT
jgi:hypothetical protein